MKIIERDVSQIGPLDHATAVRLAATEYERMLALLRDLHGDDWAAPSDCAGWDVRTLVCHVVGTAETLASFPTFVRFMRRVAKRPGLFVDEMTALHVEERSSCRPAELVERLDRAVPRAVRTRARLGWPLRAIPVKFDTPAGETLRWNIGYLYDVILTRDVWMHRVDISHPLGRTLSLTAEHDGVLVADVVAEWARSHGKPFRLTLDGPAGGTFHQGRGG
ncbi:MAG TPA: maleylpyruvate isomerase family mycothiol-dependent enzyme, partial [Acidimicrobiia bacterium]|nr:maleylpyruvate isomerase family mycothiol-dependent enzyme [Acidimicrobiia bacterium]